MNISSLSAPRRSTVALTLLAVGSFILVGCAAESDVPGSSDAFGEEDTQIDSSSGGQGAATAQATVDGRSFTFTPSTCMMMLEEAMVEGAGVDDDSGELAFLSIQASTVSDGAASEVRIELGADNAFTSTDQFYMSSALTDSDFTVGWGSGVLDIEANFVHATGEPAGSGTVDVDCGI